MLPIHKAFTKYIEEMEKTAQRVSAARTLNGSRSTTNNNIKISNSPDLDTAVEDCTHQASSTSGKANVTKSIAHTHGYGHGHPPASMPGAGSRSSIMVTNAKKYSGNNPSEATVKENQRPRTKSSRENAGSEAEDSSQDTRPSDGSSAPGCAQLGINNLSGSHDSVAPRYIPRKVVEWAIYSEHREHRPADDYDGYEGGAHPLPYIPIAYEACTFDEADKRFAMRKVPVASELETQARLQSVHQNNPTTNDFVSGSNQPQIGLDDINHSSVYLHVHPNAPRAALQAALTGDSLTQPHSSRSTSVSSLSNSARQTPSIQDMASPNSFAGSRIPHYFDITAGFSSDSLADPDSSTIMSKRRASVSSSALRDEGSLKKSTTSANRARQPNRGFATSTTNDQLASAQPTWGDGIAVFDDVFRQSLGLAVQPNPAHGLKNNSSGNCALLSPTDRNYGSQIGKKVQDDIDVAIGNISNTKGQDVNLNLLDQLPHLLSNPNFFPKLQNPVGCGLCYDAIYPPQTYHPELSTTVLRCSECKRIVGGGNVVGGDGESYYGKEADKTYLDWCIEARILEVLNLADAEGEAAYFTSFDETLPFRTNYNNFDTDFDYSEGLYEM